MRSRMQGARALVRLMGSATTSTASTAARRGVASSSARGAVLLQPHRGSAGATKARPAEAASAPVSAAPSTSVAAPATSSAAATASAAQSTSSSNSTAPSAKPPQFKAQEVAQQVFRAANRPLLEHNVLPTDAAAGIRDDSKGPPFADLGLGGQTVKEPFVMSSKAVTSLDEQQRVDLDAEMEDEMEAMDESRSLACSILQSPQNAYMPKWNTALSNVSQASFERALDSLANPAPLATSSSKGSAQRRSAAVLHEAHRLTLEQRLSALKIYLIAKARARGEETDLIEALGFEANVVVLGEPKGPSKEWGAGVATLLSEHTRPLQPPPAPVAVDVQATTSSSGAAKPKPEAELEALSTKLTQLFIEHARPAREAELESADTADPNLFLSHALFQSELPRLLAWDRVEAQMDGAVWSATHDGDTTSEQARLQMRKGVNLKALNAELLPLTDVQLDSVRRKRKKKMRKQKYRKLRKRTRIERRRQKRD